MKVLIAPHSNIQGECGVSEHVKTLASSMKNQGYSVELSKLQVNRDIPTKGFLKIRFFSNLSTVFKLCQQLKKEPDLILNWHFPSFLYKSPIEGVFNILVLSFFFKKRFVLTIHGYIFEKNISSLSLYLLFFNSGLNIVLLYPDFAKRIKRIHHWIIDRNNVSYITPFPLLNYSEKVRLSNKRKSSPIRILFFGALSNQKRIDLLINCVNTYKHHLIIASKNKNKVDCFKEGDFDRIIDNSLNLNIEYKNDVDNNQLAKLLDDTDVIILPIASRISDINSSFLLAKLTSKLIIVFTHSNTYYDSFEHIAYVNYSDFVSCHRFIEMYAKKRVKRKLDDRLQTSGQDYYDLFEKCELGG